MAVFIWGRKLPLLVEFIFLFSFVVMVEMIICIPLIYLIETIRFDFSNEKVLMCTKFINSPALAEDFRINQINQTSKFMIDDDPDFNLCTHVICSDTFMLSTKDADWTDNQRNQYKECVGLRTTYPHLKILYGVKHSPIEYYEMAGDLRKRRSFVSRVFDIVSDNKFDGLNLIWQHSSESYPMDTNMLLDEKIPSLVKELKHAFKLNDLIFIGTFAKRIVAVLPINDMTETTEWRGDVRLSTMYDLVSIANDLDYVVVESLFMKDIDNLIRLQVPVEKIIIKMPQFRTRFLHETESLVPMSKEFIMDIMECTIQKDSDSMLRKPKTGGVLVDVLFKSLNGTELQTITEAFDNERRPYGINWIFMDYYDIKAAHIESNKMKESGALEFITEKMNIIGNVFKSIV